jgi:hypothetical protein
LFLVGGNWRFDHEITVGLYASFGQNAIDQTAIGRGLPDSWHYGQQGDG